MPFGFNDIFSFRDNRMNYGFGNTFSNTASVMSGYSPLSMSGIGFTPMCAIRDRNDRLSKLTQHPVVGAEISNLINRLSNLFDKLQLSEPMFNGCCWSIRSSHILSLYETISYLDFTNMTEEEMQLKMEELEKKVDQISTEFSDYKNGSQNSVDIIDKDN